MSAALTLVQITDCHLQNNPRHLYRNYDVESALSRLLTDILSSITDLDALLWTGDLVHHGGSDGYRRLQQRIAQLALPSYWIPGNHDDAELMQQIGGSLNQRSFCSDYWVVILLDSSAMPDGKGSGSLAESELRFLRQELEQYPDKHCLVVLHHNPLPVNSRWQDRIMLANALPFWDVVTSYPQVKAVLCGHVHQEWGLEHQGVQVLTTPASSVQFKKCSDDMLLEDKPELQGPAYRVLQLHPNGSITTSVKRIAVDGCND
ncbi:phosphodiesterase [Amphritea sp. HPY]|uniref:phosphodiesterase n=1 Tax=Amphritea sp. HPY TaxID=3421652 RepID=UPI003D7C72AA